MEERIDIVDAQGKPTGKSELKSVIHQKGYYHNTAHIWFYTKQGNILLSQRSVEKLICPLMWDVSVAGHIDSGETPEQGAVRETQEEISLAISQADLTKIGVFECFQNYENGITDNEFHHTFIAELTLPLSELIPQKGEVEALKLISFSEFNQLIDTIGNNNNHFVPSNKGYYEYVLQKITEIIS